MAPRPPQTVPRRRRQALSRPEHPLSPSRQNIRRRPPAGHRPAPTAHSVPRSIPIRMPQASVEAGRSLARHGSYQRSLAQRHAQPCHTRDRSARSRTRPRRRKGRPQSTPAYRTVHKTCLARVHRRPSKSELPQKCPSSTQLDRTRWRCTPRRCASAWCCITHCDANVRSRVAQQAPFSHLSRRPDSSAGGRIARRGDGRHWHWSTGQPTLRDARGLYADGVGEDAVESPDFPPLC